jgi:AcrR family transcriptional regulator
MSPRGQAIPDIRERLFRAGERVLMAGGPGAISARSVAREAGVAAGALYNHFEDLDDFLAALVVDRFRVQAERAADLPALAGSRTVAENLSDAALALLESPTLAVAELVRARVNLSGRVMETLDPGAAGMPEIQGAIVSYLEHERALGRIAAGADAEAAALMLTGAMHHLLLLHGSELPEPGDAARRVAETIVTGIGGADHE